MRFTTVFTTLLILFVLVPACTEDHKADIETAERQYAALYLAIKKEDPKETKRAAKDFDSMLQSLGLNWVTIGSEGSEDVFRFRIGRAHKAWKATKVAINDNNLPLAALQMDRATYELSHAHPPSFNDLQMGRFYRVLSSWASLASILEDEHYCGFGWEEILRYQAEVVRNLEPVQNTLPTGLFYANSEEEADQYQRMLGEIEKRLAGLLRSINYEDRALILTEMDRTDQTIDELLKFFALSGQTTEPRAIEL